MFSGHREVPENKYEELKAWIYTLPLLSYADLCLLWNGVEENHIIKSDPDIRTFMQTELKKKFHEVKWH